MKKLLLFLTLYVGIMNAQSINFPDVNLKQALLLSNTTNRIAYSNGEYVSIDTNNNGEIELIEAQVIDSLNIAATHATNSFNISDLTGLNSFVNLKGLNCKGNQITSLDVSGLSRLRKIEAAENRILFLNVSGLTDLTYLDLLNNELQSINLSGLNNLTDLILGGNRITAINLTGFVNLKNLDLSFNQLSSIDFSDAVNLIKLSVNHNQLTALDLAGFSNLEFLNCGDNLIPTVNFLGLSGLKYLYYYNNGIDSLDVSALANLITLGCNNNNLSTLDVSALSNLSALNCAYNDLTSLDLSASSNFQFLDCSHNQLTGLDVTAQSNLSTLKFGNNQITSVDLSNNTNLLELFCHNNLLTSLDLNANRMLLYMDASENTNLERLFMNNGTCVQPPLAYLGLANCVNLSYVCVDEEGIPYVQNQLAINSGATNAVVNSYCSFSPSGNYNTITGTIKLDANANGCDASDEVFPYLKVNINDGTSQGSAFLNTTGNYQFYTEAGNYTVTPAIENPAWFNFTPVSADINFADNNNNTAVQDFCLIPNGIHQDVSVVIAPIFYARPGFNATYQLVYTNKGNQTLSGSVRFSFDDDLIDFVSASAAPSSTAIGIMNWNYSNLQPFESRSIEITFNVNATTDTPAVNISDQLSFSASISPVEADENPLDNEFMFNQTVIDSDILNHIFCVEGTVIDPSYIGEYLHYVINFENVGTIAAQNAVIRFEIDPVIFDINSLQLLDASNMVFTRIVGNVVEFIFQNINLEIGGHGHILLKLRTNSNLTTTDIVSNRASIYYDYNAPVDTGIFNTVFQTLSNPDFEMDNSVAIYPNPVANAFTVKANNNIKSLQIFDAQGRMITTNLEDELESKLDISSYAKGIYFIKVTTVKGVNVQKLLKE